jgi:hypothetical protein
MLICAIQLPFFSILHVIGCYGGEGQGVSNILEYVQPKLKILLKKLQFGQYGTTDLRRWEEDFDGMILQTLIFLMKSYEW